MRTLRNISLLYALLLCLSACQPEEWNTDDIPVAEEEEELCEFVFGSTRAMESGADYRDTTYRAQLFYQGLNTNKWERQDSLITPYTGTYCNPKNGNAWLTPCAVDANYAYDSLAAEPENSCYGLRAGRYHNYYLFLNSPASEYVKYGEVRKINPVNSSDTATLEYWGLPYQRGGEPKDHPAVSGYALVTAKGLTLQDNYRYNLDDNMELMEYRSRVAISVRCGDAISHANFKKLEIKGLRKNAIFRPFAKDFFFVDEAANYEDALVYECADANGIHLGRGGSEGAYTEGESVSLTGTAMAEHLDNTLTNQYFTYILSDDYKSLDKDNQYIKKPAELCLTLVSDGGLPITLDPIPMSFIFEPQKSYFYLITINSVYLSVSVIARNWDYIDELNEVVDEPVADVLNISIADWTAITLTDSVEPGEGGGDDAPRYDKSTEGITTSPWNTPGGGNGSIDD